MLPASISDAPNASAQAFDFVLLTQVSAFRSQVSPSLPIHPRHALAAAALRPQLSRLVVARQPLHARNVTDYRCGLVAKLQGALKFAPACVTIPVARQPRLRQPVPGIAAGVGLSLDPALSRGPRRSSGSSSGSRSLPSLYALRNIPAPLGTGLPLPRFPRLAGL